FSCPISRPAASSARAPCSLPGLRTKPLPELPELKVRTAMTRPTPEVLAHRPHPPSTASTAAQPAAQPAARTAPVTGAPARVTEETRPGAAILVRSLEALGADVVFGIPGGAILPAYDPLFDSDKVRHILVRHEQGAGHAATGYAQATGKVGVCMATSG